MLSAKPDKSADPAGDVAAAASSSKGDKTGKGQRGQSVTPGSQGKVETGGANKNKTEASTSKDQRTKARLEWQPRARAKQNLRSSQPWRFHVISFIMAHVSKEMLALSHTSPSVIKRNKSLLNP